MDKSRKFRSRAQQLARAGDIAGAIGAYRQALAAVPDDAENHYQLGMLCGRVNRINDALLHLRRACELSPDNAEALLGLGASLFASSEYADAVPYLEKALSIRPGLSACHYYLGNIYLLRSRPIDAIRHFETALAASPAQLDLLINFATACEQTQQLERCRELADRALAISPDNPSAGLLLARIEKRAGEYKEAEDRLNRILRAQLHPVVAASAYFMLGHILDREGRQAEAFSAFDRASKIRQQIAKSVPCDQGYYLKLIEQNKSRFSAQALKRWRRSEARDGLTPPVFFVGFPRSGTTLVEQILNTHPRLVTTNEQPFIDRLIREYENLSERDIPLYKRVDRLTPADLHRLRKRYFELLEQELDSSQDGVRVVDKLALNIVQLGFIKRIFPESPVIVALRDPRDCCLSGFMQEFKLSPATLHFLTLESTARFYDRVMDLWFHYRETLDLNYFEYRYEDLIADFEGLARQLFAFIDVEWDSSVLDYHRAAKTRHISTPSYHDVTSPIYSRSVGRWKQYREYLGPILPVLEKYVQCLGYAESQAVLSGATSDSVSCKADVGIIGE